MSPIPTSYQGKAQVPNTCRGPLVIRGWHHQSAWSADALLQLPCLALSRCPANGWNSQRSRPRSPAALPRQSGTNALDLEEAGIPYSLLSRCVHKESIDKKNYTYAKPGCPRVQFKHSSAPSAVARVRRREAARGKKTHPIGGVRTRPKMNMNDIISTNTKIKMTLRINDLDMI